MQYSYIHFPCAEKKFSLCDCTIDKIICNEDSIKFVFSKGFFAVEAGGVASCSSGYVELNNCNPNELSCYIINRKPTQKGAQLLGIPLSIVDLADLLATNERGIEIYLELYDFNYLHWRGVLLPHNSNKLSDNVLIETCGSFPITFSCD